MKKIAYLSVLVALFCLSSCLTDFEETFDEPASKRMQTALSDYQKLLISSENGWYADYYQGVNYAVGGYAMFLKFKADGTVDVSCEVPTNLPAGQVANSQWEMISDMGPVLSFITYNPVMHYFSEPYASMVNGRQGDYEFIVMSASEDTIKMKGKKRGCEFNLIRNKANKAPATYFSEVSTMADRLSEFGMFSFVLDGKRVGMTAVVDRTFSIGYVDDEDGQEKVKKVPYTFTPTGIRFAYPLVFLDSGSAMQNFIWDAAKEQYTCTDPGANAYFDVYFPDDYELRYGEVLGKWKIKYHGASTTTWVETVVEIIEKKKNATFTMVAPQLFSWEPGIEISFNAQKGIISILNQNAGKDPAGTGYDVRLCSYDRAAGYLSTGSTGPIGIVGKWNKNEGGVTSITFVDNGAWVTYKPNGFLLRLYNGSTSMGNYTANVADYRFNDITITKIND